MGVSVDHSTEIVTSALPVAAGSGSAAAAAAAGAAAGSGAEAAFAGLEPDDAGAAGAAAGAALAAADSVAAAPVADRAEGCAPPPCPDAISARRDWFAFLVASSRSSLAFRDRMVSSFACCMIALRSTPGGRNSSPFLLPTLPSPPAAALWRLERPMLRCALDVPLWPSSWTGSVPAASARRSAYVTMAAVLASTK